MYILVVWPYCIVTYLLASYSINWLWLRSTFIGYTHSGRYTMGLLWIFSPITVIAALVDILLTLPGWIGDLIMKD